jgi:hypothetical protein
MADQQRTAVGVKVRLVERERFTDPQSSARGASPW